MARIYHWKHGWIPLDHPAARSSDTGIHNRRDVAKALFDMHSVPAADRAGARLDIQTSAIQHDAVDLLPTSMQLARAQLAVDHASSRAGMHSPSQADHERLHAAGIKVPPAWTDVYVADRADAPLQVHGRDAKGRAQYVYSAAHSQSQAAKKFSRVGQLREHLSALDARLAVDAGHRDDAAALLLIRRLGLRPGSDVDTGAEKKAFGATNLRAEHVSVSGDTVHLRFTGKKGVALDFTVRDKQIADVLRGRLASKKPGERLFTADARRTADYLHTSAPGFKLKDLRTARGTALAQTLVDGMSVPETKREYLAGRRRVAEQVSSVLGNTPAVALESYIDPAVFRRWDAANAVESNRGPNHGPTLAGSTRQGDSATVRAGAVPTITRASASAGTGTERPGRLALTPAELENYQRNNGLSVTRTLDAATKAHLRARF